MATATAVLDLRHRPDRWSGTGPLIVSVAVLVALCALVARGVNPAYVVAVAAVPLVLALGYRYSFALLAAMLIARPLIDSVPVAGLTAGIGIGLLVLAGLAALHDVRALVIMLVVVVPIGLAGFNGFDRWGVVAVEEAVRLLSIVAVFAVATVTPKAISRVTAARVVQLAAVVPAVVAIVQAVTGTGTQISDTLRSTGTLAQANGAGLFFGLGALASLVLVVEGAGRRLNLVALAFFSVAVVTTGSIGGLVTLVAAMLVYLALAYGLFATPTMLGAGGVALLVVVTLLSPIGQGRLAEFFVPTGPTLPDNSVTWRFEAWGKILRAWREHPVTGLGLGATTEKGGILNNNIAHNEYLYLLGEMGLIGLVLVLAGAAAFVSFMARFRRLGASHLNLAFAGAVLAAFGVNALNDNPLHTSPSVFMFAFLLATLWRCARRELGQVDVGTPVA